MPETPLLGQPLVVQDSVDPCPVKEDAKHCAHPLGPTIMAQPADGTLPYLFTPLMCCWCRGLRLTVEVAGAVPAGHGPYVEYRPMSAAQRLNLFGAAPPPGKLHV